MEVTKFINPFRPGAGHMPPYLAGRDDERHEFARLLKQDVVVENLVLTGLRGVGKTVLLETFKPLAQSEGWLWVGTDLSEASSVTEHNLALRLITDLAVITSSTVIGAEDYERMGFSGERYRVEHRLDYDTLNHIFQSAPGLTADKLKHTLEVVWSFLSLDPRAGVVFAYDEAQLLSDHAEKDEYPLSLLLDTFQSLQRKNIRYMLALTGLPTLFPKLVEARTYAERMFRVVFLNRLDDKASAEAVRKPTESKDCPVRFTEQSISEVVSVSGGYPYFIQFTCREIYDIWVQALRSGSQPPPIPIQEIERKLDTDFFAGRWAKATDRQRDLLAVIAKLPTCDVEFSVQEVVEMSRNESGAPFSSSHVNQMLATLCERGLVYKNRHGRYSFAVPLFDRFILRQIE